MAKKKFYSNWVFRYLGLFILIFVVVYGFINASALLSKISYLLGGKFGNTENVIEISDTGTLPKVSGRKILQNNHLYIPKIKIDAEISWDVAKADELNQLKSSVIQLSGTALPGEKGNVFITGHSSYYWWLGKYTNIFALLNKLQPGDKIAIAYKDKIYTYKVYDSVVVRPSNVEVMRQGSGKNLYLMTCVPIGTNWNRLIVKAKQINVVNR
jgi:LPXTG-site transpeptidase (sortase) family protein